MHVANHFNFFIYSLAYSGRFDSGTTGKFQTRHDVHLSLKEEEHMSKRKGIIMTAIGAGVTYLMRNKQARDKLFSTVSGMMKGSSSSTSKRPQRIDIK